MNMTVTCCEDCPLYDLSDWGMGACEHPDSEYNVFNDEVADRFKKCPLKKGTLVIELIKENQE